MCFHDELLSGKNRNDPILLANIKKYHNTLCPSKILHKRCFEFLGTIKKSPEKIKTMLMQMFRGANKEYYGIFYIG